jgi:ribosome-associated heat shock protein Hsp15
VAAGPAGPGDAAARIRLDKWLWQARFFKSRSLAVALIGKDGCRVNGQKTTRAGHLVGAGDQLTFVQGGRVRTIQVVAPGARRGPASEATTLYLDLAPPIAASPGLEAGPGTE